MSTDPLNNEISVSGSISADGMKAAAKSRFVSALDRFFGNLVDYFNPMMEGKIEEQRATIGARVAVIKSLGENAAKRISEDGNYIDRFVENEFLSSVRKFENKALVVSAALNDLRENPPTYIENDSDEGEIDSAVIDRIKKFSEDSNTDELREKWGRVLASEIRNPGKLNLRSIRIIDEIDTETAVLFESVCKFRIDQLIPFFFPKIQYMEMKKLVSSELILDRSGSNQVVKMSKMETAGAGDMWFCPLGNYGVAFQMNSNWRSFINHENRNYILIGDDKPAIPVYIVSDSGLSIANIINTDQDNNILLLMEKLAEIMPGVEIHGYRRDKSGKTMHFKRLLK